MNQTWFRNLNTIELVQFTQNMKAEIGFFGGRYYRTEQGTISLNDIFLHRAFTQAQKDLNLPVLKQVIKNLQEKDHEGENLLRHASLFQKILTTIRRSFAQILSPLNRAQIIELYSEQNLSYHFEQVIPITQSKTLSDESKIKIKLFQKKLASTNFQELYEFLKSLNNKELKNNYFIALAKYARIPINTLVIGLSRVEANEQEKTMLLNELIPVLLTNIPFYAVVEGVKNFRKDSFWTINILIDFRVIIGCKDHQEDTPSISPLLAKHMINQLQRVIYSEDKQIQAKLPSPSNIGVQLVLQQKAECQFPTSLIQPLLEEMIHLDDLIDIDTSDLQRFDEKATSTYKKLHQKVEDNFFAIRHDPLYNILNPEEHPQKLL